MEKQSKVSAICRARLCYRSKSKQSNWFQNVICAHISAVPKYASQNNRSDRRKMTAVDKPRLFWCHQIPRKVTKNFNLSSSTNSCQSHTCVLDTEQNFTIPTRNCPDFFDKKHKQNRVERARQYVCMNNKA